VSNFSKTPILSALRRFVLIKIMNARIAAGPGLARSV
jgi:hypothetical protein